MACKRSSAEASSLRARLIFVPILISSRHCVVVAVVAAAAAGGNGNRVWVRVTMLWVG